MVPWHALQTSSRPALPAASAGHRRRCHGTRNARGAHRPRASFLSRVRENSVHARRFSLLSILSHAIYAAPPLPCPSVHGYARSSLSCSDRPARVSSCSSCVSRSPPCVSEDTSSVLLFFFFLLFFLLFNSIHRVCVYPPPVPPCRAERSPFFLISLVVADGAPLEWSVCPLRASVRPFLLPSVCLSVRVSFLPSFLVRAEGTLRWHPRYLHDSRTRKIHRRRLAYKTVTRQTPPSFVAEETNMGRIFACVVQNFNHRRNIRGYPPMRILVGNAQFSDRRYFFLNCKF